MVADDALLLREWAFPDGGKLLPENNDCANLMLRFASGLVLPAQICWTAAEAEGWAVDIRGSEGRILSRSLIFPTSLDCTLYAGRMEGEPSHSGDLKPVAVDNFRMRSPAVCIDAWHAMPPAYPMALSMHAMVQTIRGVGKAAPDFGQAWQVERVQEAIRLSSLERRWVSVSSIA